MAPPSILIVGRGRLGSALSKRLVESGYKVTTTSSRRSVRFKKIPAEIVWFCVPDAEITRVASGFSSLDWRRKCSFHSSGVLTSDALVNLRDTGASCASVHPLMTFVAASVPDLTDVSFAIEGDAKAVRVARMIVRNLGGRTVAIKRQDKVAYHTFATMICPLLLSLLAASESVATLAGMPEREARRRMMPIIQQTLRNYEKLGPAGAFSGPIVRGDSQTVRAHLKVLSREPIAHMVYIALAKAALDYLPSANQRGLARLLRK